MKAEPWVDLAPYLAAPLAATASWFARGRRRDRSDAHLADAEATDTITQAAARTVTMIAEQVDRLQERVEAQQEQLTAQGGEIARLKAQLVTSGGAVVEQGQEISDLRAQLAVSDGIIADLTRYAIEVGAWARMISARFLEATKTPAPPPPDAPQAIPDPDAPDDTIPHTSPPDAVGGTPWTPPSPRT